MLFCTSACADRLTVDLTDGALHISAIDVRLADILQAIAEVAAIEMQLRDPLTETVTFSSAGRGVPQTIDRLLSNKSYALQFAPREGRRHGPNKLWVFAQAPGAVNAPDATDNKARYEAIYRLGESGERDNVRLLTAWLDDPDGRLRQVAVEALGDLGGEEASNALAYSLDDPDASIRIDSVYALGEIGGPTARRLLSRARQDPDAGVREAAAEALDDLEQVTAN